jgi:hypothetical protein
MFAAFPSETRQELMTRAQLKAGDEPVLACVQNLEQWTLFTTQHLFSFWDNKLLVLGWNEISDADPQDGEKLLKNPLEKLRRERLFIITVGGATHEILLEAKSYHGLWNVINLLTTISKGSCPGQPLPE